jgi:S1-C subfamily serine protease
MRDPACNKIWALAAILMCFGPVAAPSWALTEEERNNIAVYEKAAPGVVNITSITLEQDFFFMPAPREGVGSGAVVDKAGHILTNNHVIKDAQSIEVTLSDGSKWRGSLVGTDPDNDLAIIKVAAPPARLHPLTLGKSSDLKVGQKVLAIGNPFGLGVTLTTGVVSSVGRFIRSPDGNLMEDLIQTDAAINPGNSGGPLLDSQGEVIGINSAIVSPTGGSIGLGFAVPVDTAKRIVPELIEKGYVSYPWLGVTLFPLNSDLAKALRLSVDSGAMIVELVPGGPADRAGLRGGSEMLQIGNALLPVGGDVIVALEGDPVSSSEDCTRMVQKYKPGDRINVRIMRDNHSLNIPVVVGERPRPEGHE